MTRTPDVYAGCTHTRVHRHGTRSCAQAHGCGCVPCRAAVRQYAGARELAIADGRWEPMTDAGPVREHVDRLREGGMTLAQIAHAASRARADGVQVTVHLSTVERLVYGQTRGGANVPLRRVRTEVARALRSVRPDQAPAAATARVERVVQSLANQGWGEAEIGGALVRASSGVRAAGADSAAGARALAAQGAPALRAALDRHAGRTGCPLGATLSPQAVAIARNVLRVVVPDAASGRARPAAVRILLGAGLTASQAAQVLGVSRRTVQRRVAAIELEQAAGSVIAVLERQRAVAAERVVAQLDETTAVASG